MIKRRRKPSGKLRPATRCAYEHVMSFKGGYARPRSLISIALGLAHVLNERVPDGLNDCSTKVQRQWARYFINRWFEKEFLDAQLR